MKSNEELYNERLIRFKKAIALEKSDKTTMQFNAEAFCAKQMGVKLSDFCVNAELSITTIINCLNLLGDVDVMDKGYLYAPILGTGNLAKVKVPGKELPPLFSFRYTLRSTPWGYNLCGHRPFC